MSLCSPILHLLHPFPLTACIPVPPTGCTLPPPFPVPLSANTFRAFFCRLYSCSRQATYPLFQSLLQFHRQRTCPTSFFVACTPVPPSANTPPFPVFTPVPPSANMSHLFFCRLYSCSTVSQHTPFSRLYSCSTVSKHVPPLFLSPVLLFHRQQIHMNTPRRHDVQFGTACDCHPPRFNIVIDTRIYCRCDQLKN